MNKEKLNHLAFHFCADGAQTLRVSVDLPVAKTTAKAIQIEMPEGAFWWPRWQLPKKSWARSEIVEFLKILRKTSGSSIESLISVHRAGLGPTELRSGSVRKELIYRLYF